MNVGEFKDVGVDPDAVLAATDTSALVCTTDDGGTDPEGESGGYETETLSADVSSLFTDLSGVDCERASEFEGAQPASGGTNTGEEATAIDDLFVEIEATTTGDSAAGYATDEAALSSLTLEDAVDELLEEESFVWQDTDDLE